MGNRIKTLISVVLVVIVCASSTVIVNANNNKRDTASEASVSDSARVGSPTKSTKTTVKKAAKQAVKKIHKNVGKSFYVKKTKAVLHKTPSKNGKIVKSLYKGRKVTVRDVVGNWYRVGKNKWIHKNHLCKKDPIIRYQGVALSYSGSYDVSNNKLTRRKGVVRFRGHKETYYSQKVLPGGGLNIPGRHVANDGTVRDKDGYICVSANYLSKHSKIMTSLGPGKVYDCGSMTGKWIDIYTAW